MCGSVLFRSKDNAFDSNPAWKSRKLLSQTEGIRCEIGSGRFSGLPWFRTRRVHKIKSINSINNNMPHSRMNSPSPTRKGSRNVSLRSEGVSKGGWMRSNGLWNLPNVLSVARVFMIPLLMALFYSSLPNKAVLCFLVFALASVTDFLDGYLARKWKITSPFGAFLDPVADKLMVCTAVVLLSMAHHAQVLDVALPTAITLSREIGVSALREWMGSQGQRDTVQVGFMGKCKTALQMVSVSGLLLAIPTPGSTLEYLYTPMIVLYWGSTFLAVASGYLYFQAAWPLLSAQSKNSQ